MKLLESSDRQPPIIEAIAMIPGQTGIVTASTTSAIPIGSLVMRGKHGALIALDTSETFGPGVTASVRVQPHAPGTRLTFETI